MVTDTQRLELSWKQWTSERPCRTGVGHEQSPHAGGQAADPAGLHDGEEQGAHAHDAKPDHALAELLEVALGHAGLVHGHVGVELHDAQHEQRAHLLQGVGAQGAVESNV